MRWNSPEFALLFALIPLVIWYKIYILRNTKKGGVRYPLASRAAKLKKSLKVRLLFIPELMRLSLLVLLIFALMQPQYGIEREEIIRKGIDIMIVFDISGSMAAEDFKPNRFEASKRITENFISGLEDHRVGLVVFSGLALTQCPLTMDHGTVIELLRRSYMGMLKTDGTAIGDGLINAVYKFEDEKTDDPTDKRSKVVILLTDGENNAGMVDPLDAAKVASERNIKVYSIGMGSEEGAPVPVVRGGRKMYARNPDGSLYKATFDEQLLKDIAFLTDGEYFRATESESLEEIYRQIAEMETGKIDVSRTVQYSERFFWFLAPAFALLLLEVFVRSRIFMRLF